MGGGGLAMAVRVVRRSASFSARKAVTVPRQILFDGASAAWQRRAERKSERRQQAAQAAERRQHETEEAASQRALANFHRCPSCSVFLEKNGGCDHFTCGACRHEFCWICDAPFNGPRGIRRQGNSAHCRGRCPYWRP